MNTELPKLTIESMQSCKDISIAIRIALTLPDRLWRNQEPRRLRLKVIHDKMLRYQADHSEESSAAE